MNPTDQNQQPPAQTISNPLNAMRAGEVNICEIQRHPIGLLGVYGSFGFLLLLIAVVTFIVPSIATSYSHSFIYEIGALVFIVALLFAAVFSLIATKVYKGNRWILTSDSLTQVTQRSLFDKQSSQLSLGNLEDVTAVQDGIMAHMFNYGVLRVETAGERSKFALLYCPNPNDYAQKILVAREAFEQDQRFQPPPASATPTGPNINTQ